MLAKKTPIIDMGLNTMAYMVNAVCVHVAWLDALYPVLSCLVHTVDRFYA